MKNIEVYGEKGETYRWVKKFFTNKESRIKDYLSDKKIKILRFRHIEK